VRFANRPNAAGLNNLDGAAQAVFRRALIPHLRGDFVLIGDFFHHAGFIHVVGERLLAIDVLLHLHGHDAGRRMRVIGSAHGHGVDLLVHLLQHLAKVVVLLGVGKSLGLRVELIVIDVA